MNDDLLKLQEYAKQWHQPVNSEKIQFVMFTQIVNHPKLNINYENSALEQTKIFKYRGYVSDTTLSFRSLVDGQLRKCRQTYPIMKHIHRQFPSYYKLKLLFFTTYIWPHLSAVATIYCLLSSTLRERINSFYRCCLRIIYCLFKCPTTDIHEKIRLPTLEKKFQKNLKKRL
jgi:hypothetical protein